jgi:phosphocarrier protein
MGMDVVDESTNKAEGAVAIPNRQGLHARPVMQFVDLANSYACSVSVCRGTHCVDGKSPMEMMLLEATQGTELRLVALGDDAHEAVEALVKLIEEGFGED